MAQVGDKGLHRHLDTARIFLFELEGLGEIVVAQAVDLAHALRYVSALQVAEKIARHGRRPLPGDHALLVAEGDYGIDRGGATGWDERGGGCRGDQDERYAHEDERVAGAFAHPLGGEFVEGDA